MATEELLWLNTTQFYLHIVVHVSVVYFPPGDVTGQFTVPPATCPGDTFTFICTVTGDRNGLTTWRVGNGSNDCSLQHGSPHPTSCRLSDAFTARSMTGFGQEATLFSSTLSGTATPGLDGILVECFGPANNVDQGNRVGGSTLQILGINWSVYPTHFFVHYSATIVY